MPPGKNELLGKIYLRRSYSSLEKDLECVSRNRVKETWVSEEKKTLQGTAVQRKYTTRYKILYKDQKQRLTEKKENFSCMTWEMDTNSFMTGRNVSFRTALMWVFRSAVLEALKPKTGTQFMVQKTRGGFCAHIFRAAIRNQTA